MLKRRLHRLVESTLITSCHIVGNHMSSLIFQTSLTFTFYSKVMAVS